MLLPSLLVEQHLCHYIILCFAFYKNKWEVLNSKLLHFVVAKVKIFKGAMWCWFYFHWPTVCFLEEERGEMKHKYICSHIYVSYVCIHTHTHTHTYTVAPSLSQWQVTVLFGHFALRLVFMRVPCWGWAVRRGGNNLCGETSPALRVRRPKLEFHFRCFLFECPCHTSSLMLSCLLWEVESANSADLTGCGGRIHCYR